MPSLDSDIIRITHTVSSIESEASGPSYTVPRLAQSLALKRRTSVSLLTLGEPAESVIEGVTHTRCRQDFSWAPPLSRVGLSAQMMRALTTERCDIVHTHGLWMMPNIYPALATEAHQAKFILSPRGMLGVDALAFSKRTKQVFWWLLQKRAAKRVSCFHATSAQELEDIRRVGLDQPVAIVPNGIDLPDLGMIASPSTRPRNGPMKTALSLGRVHPKKGLDRLLVAWAAIAEDYPNWQLRIVGPSEQGHAADLKGIIARKNILRVSIEQAVFGSEKQQLLRNSDLFVLPTLNENFAISVAESLAVETPVISTKGAPWQGLIENDCGWWIDHGKEAMVSALKQALNLSTEERQKMGRKGRAWMARDFGWDRISEQMFAVYTWLIHGTKRPDWVEV